MKIFAINVWETNTINSDKDLEGRYRSYEVWANSKKEIIESLKYFEWDMRYVRIELIHDYSRVKEFNSWVHTFKKFPRKK